LPTNITGETGSAPTKTARDGEHPLGGVVENNHFGTHEFMDLCAQLGCEPYICGNVGAVPSRRCPVGGIPTFAVRAHGTPPSSERACRAVAGEILGVGNESWGCGGRMTPDYYANLYRQFGVYCRDYGDNRLFRIACGPGDDYRWTEVLMKKSGIDDQRGPYMDGLALHYYTQVRRLPDGSREVPHRIRRGGMIEIIQKGRRIESWSAATARSWICMIRQRIA